MIVMVVMMKIDGDDDDDDDDYYVRNQSDSSRRRVCRKQTLLLLTTRYYSFFVVPHRRGRVSQKKGAIQLICRHFISCIGRVLHPSICQSINPCINPSIHLSINPFIHASIHPPVHKSIHPFQRLFFRPACFLLWNRLSKRSTELGINNQPTGRPTELLGATRVLVGRTCSQGPCCGCEVLDVHVPKVA